MSGQPNNETATVKNWLQIFFLVGTIIATNFATYTALREDIAELRAEQGIISYRLQLLEKQFDNNPVTLKK